MYVCHRESTACTLRGWHTMALGPLAHRRDHLFIHLPGCFWTIAEKSPAKPPFNIYSLALLLNTLAGSDLANLPTALRKRGIYHIEPASSVDLISSL